MSQDLERRVAQLEYRLGEYHQWLEASLEHDRKFQLRATWGIVNTSLGIVAFAGTIHLAEQWFGMTGWLLGTLAAVVAFVAFGVATAWSDKGRLGDEKKLSRLPEWEKI